MLHWLHAGSSVLLIIGGLLAALRRNGRAFLCLCLASAGVSVSSEKFYWVAYVIRAYLAGVADVCDLVRIGLGGGSSILFLAITALGLMSTDSDRLSRGRATRCILSAGLVGFAGFWLGICWTGEDPLGIRSMGIDVGSLLPTSVLAVFVGKLSIGALILLRELGGDRAPASGAHFPYLSVYMCMSGLRVIVLCIAVLVVPTKYFVASPLRMDTLIDLMTGIPAAYAPAVACVIAAASLELRSRAKPLRGGGCTNRFSE